MQRHICRKLRKGIPGHQSSQQQRSAQNPDGPSRERNQQSFGEQLPQNAEAARSQGEAHRNFPRTIGDARGKQASQVGASGQQD